MDPSHPVTMPAASKESEPSPTVPTSGPPLPPPGGAARWTRIPLVLAVASLVLGVSALGIAVASYELSSAPTPKIVVAHATLDFGGYRIPHLGHCANVTSLVLKIDVSGPGVVEVAGSIEVELIHASGDYAAAAIFVSNASSTCPGVPETTYIDTGLASGVYIEDITAVGSFTVQAAGTASFYVTGYDYSTGTDYSEGGFPNLVAVFYPSS